MRKQIKRGNTICDDPHELGRTEEEDEEKDDDDDDDDEKDRKDEKGERGRKKDISA